MEHSLLLALVGFAFVTSITPGPNNLMLMASGANFGFRRSVPHMLGISIGHAFMIVLVGAGLIRIFDTWPAAHVAMKVLSAAYLMFLAWKIAHAAAPAERAAEGTPLTFIQAALFQWVNPKAWFMALTAVSVYAPSQSLGAVLAVATVFAATNLPSVSTWAVLGQSMRRLLTTGKRLQVFNWTMAVLLLLSLVPIL